LKNPEKTLDSVLSIVSLITNCRLVNEVVVLTVVNVATPSEFAGTPLWNNVPTVRTAVVGSPLYV
jgi:hypothetical protein